MIYFLPKFLVFQSIDNDGTWWRLLQTRILGAKWDIYVHIPMTLDWLIGSYTSLYWRSWISFTSVRNSVFSRVERCGTSGKTLNFSHECNKDECKYLFLPFQLKNKACRFHSFIRMSMPCLLHKILQRHVQCSKYTLI